MGETLFVVNSISEFSWHFGDYCMFFDAHQKSHHDTEKIHFPWLGLAESENEVYHMDIISCVNAGIDGAVGMVLSFGMVLSVVAFIFTYFFSCSLRKTSVVPLAVFSVFYFVSGGFLVKGATGKYFTAKQECKEVCLEKFESLQISAHLPCVVLHPVTTDASENTFSAWSHNLASNEPDLLILRNLH